MDNKIEIKDVTPKVEIHRPDGDKSDSYSPRSHIYVRAVKGVYTRVRRQMNIVFMLLFFLLPWLQFNGTQAILLDIEAQRFHIFGMTLWPQDLTLLAWIFMIGAFALFFVTTFLGRVWCGYMCPQTVWTFIFIWFEERLEGTANQRKKLDERAMDFDKFRRKTAKHVCWFGFSLLTSMTFIGYFTPIDQLFVNFFVLEAGTWFTIWVLFFAVCTYGNAGWMREIMCTHICPYARFQSAMFDKDTFTVTYNANRGESRGPRGRKADPKALGLGDCIDCKLCVQVCPTGIDIRNGLQYECINCGACIDACDGVMDKMGYEKGLISYSTEHAVSGKPTRLVRGKFLGYGIVLVAVCGLLGYEIMTRQLVDLDIIRDRNQLYRETVEGMIENVYTLKLMNKSQQPMQYQISATGIEGLQWQGDNKITVAAGELATLPVSLVADPNQIKLPVTEIEFVVTNLTDPDEGEHQQASRFFNRRN